MPHSVLLLSDWVILPRANLLINHFNVRALSTPNRDYTQTIFISGANFTSIRLDIFNRNPLYLRPCSFPMDRIHLLVKELTCAHWLFFSWSPWLTTWCLCVFHTQMPKMTCPQKLSVLSFVQNASYTTVCGWQQPVVNLHITESLMLYNKATPRSVSMTTAASHRKENEESTKSLFRNCYQKAHPA